MRVTIIMRVLQLMYGLIYDKSFAIYLSPNTRVTCVLNPNFQIEDLLWSRAPLSPVTTLR